MMNIVRGFIELNFNIINYLFWLGVLLLSLLLSIAIKYIYRRHKISQQVPSGRYRFFDVLGDIKFASFDNMEQNYGHHEIHKGKPFYCMWIGYVPLFFIAKAELAEEVLFEPHLNKGWVYEWFKPLLKTGLLTSDPKKMKIRRKLLNPCFHFDILQEYLPTFNEKSLNLVEELRSQSNEPRTDLINLAFHCTLDILCVTLMNLDMKDLENEHSDYILAIQRSSRKFMQRFLNAAYLFDFSYFYLTKAGRDQRKDFALLHDFTTKLIQKKKQRFLSESKNLKTKRKSFLDLLMELHLNEGVLSVEDIQEEVDTFLIEGHDTIAVTLFWALYLIGLYKEVHDKIDDELELIFGSDRERFITNEDLNQLKYLDYVIKESQRIYPAVPSIAREANKDILYNGYKIPKGSMCIISPFLIQRDKDQFPDPLKFDPDRFLPENSTNRHRFSYIPFSSGPRNCIGQRFAMLELKVIVANILRNFHVETLTPRDQIIISFEITLMPKSEIKIKFTPK